MTAPQLAPGTVVAGKYSVGACLGFGGSSATYHAAGADGREVALKLFDPAIRQRADIMAALEQTYAATNQLPQDVAVPLLDAGYDPQTGAPFSITEKLKIPSLMQVAAQRPLSPDEVASMLTMMGRVLDYAHARQLSHHALKPTNVFVGFAQGGAVKVTDFGAGLARTAVPSNEGYALTAPWIAPEQVQGGTPAGPAADVFSAGLIAFFALTGRSYWRSCQGAPDLAGWQRELMSPRTPPSARALQLGVTLNSAFDQVLGNALSLDPAQRFRTVGELANAFEGLVSSRGPESQATMAFPAMGLGGEYPPPPKPTGGLGMQPPQGGAQGYPQPQQPPPQQQQPYQQPPMQQPPQQQQQPYAQPQQGGYVAAQPGPSTALDATSSGRPIDPAVLRRPAQPTRLAPILVGVVALLLLGGAAAAVVLMGKKPAGPEAAASASASAPVAADTAPAASAPPAETAPPADTAAPAASADADAGPPAADEQEVSLVCDPECDEIKVDDKPLDLTKSPMTLPPGKHTIVASKAEFKPVTEKVTVVKGTKLEKKWKLLPAKVAAPAGPAVPGTTKPCGKFLKRCK